MTVAASASFWTAVCYITAISGDTTYQASGVIIGPHTVLTASHVVWDGALQQAMTDIRVYPGYADGDASVSGAFATHANPIGDASHTLTKAASAQDFAIIDFAADLSAFGHFDIQTATGGGTVHVTGYPAIGHGVQSDQVGTVTVDASAAVLDYGTVTVQGGNSGGPVWIDIGDASHPDPTVIGVVSTTSWATALTAADLATIRAWQASDAFLWATPQVSSASGATALTTDTAHPLPAYRFYDTVTNDHFYTTDAAEAASIKANLPSLTFEGCPWATPEKGAGTTDVFRFFDTVTKTHFLTQDLNEAVTIKATMPTFTYEGVAFEAYTSAHGPDTVTLERFFNTETHVHTYALPDEAVRILAGGSGSGWIDEGHGFIVHSA